MNNVIAVLIAVVGAGGPLVWLLERFDKRNTGQHEQNLSVLKEIHNHVENLGERVQEVSTDVKDIRNDLYDHISFHAHKETTDGIARRTRDRETTE